MGAHLEPSCRNQAALVSYAGIKSVKCELCWFLGIIEFDEAIRCIRRNSIVKRTLDEKTLVNAFADRHAFELEQIAIESGALVADEAVLQRHAKDLVSLEGSVGASVAPYIFLQHSLKLLKKNAESLELQEHVQKHDDPAFVFPRAFFSRTKEAISAIYAELKVDVPTLLFVDLPQHAAAGLPVTLRSKRHL